MTGNRWNNLPEELRYLNQWCLAAKNGSPMSVKEGKLFNASVRQPSQWMTFDNAIAEAEKRGLLVGFILHESDSFACIDLDVKDAENCPDKPELWTTAEQFDLYYRIMLQLNSYTEASRSGKGLHIWVRATIGKGVKRDGVEIYSQERFIICTGKVVLGKDIAEQNLIINNMASQMRTVSGVTTLEEVEQEHDDWYILDMAHGASNAEKFDALWLGDWRALGFPSQSEADLALMSMLTFYSPSNAQCRRMFRDCALGKRDKAQKDDRYLNLTLQTIRAREEVERSADLRAIAQSADLILQTRSLAQQEIARMQGGIAVGSVSHSVQPLHVSGQSVPNEDSGQPVSVAVTMAGPLSEGYILAGQTGLSWPPGFAGRIAQFVYQSAPRPVKEVAIVAALGLLAGICGKAWHIPQSGLNLYIILVARSAIGKEAMHSGISALMRSCTLKMPLFSNFINFSEFASGPALIKACASNPSFVNVSGEWGRKLNRMANNENDGPLSTLRTQMINMYQKSGPQSIVGGLTYSDKEKNVESVSGVSYSMIGETTPDTFYESLTESMMQDGFMSRFLIVEYEGERPPLNQYQMLTPDNALEDGLVRLAFQAQNLISSSTSQPLSRNEAAAVIMHNFELECDKQINATLIESTRQMWNRAALKSLRVASLLAVADNFVSPCINEVHMQWALQLVKRDIEVISRRINEGDVGSGDDSRERKLLIVIQEYISDNVSASYKVNDKMKADGIITRRYLQIRTCRVASFYKNRLGHTNSLNLSIQTMISNGMLMEVAPAKLSELYNFNGKAYRILKTN